MKYKIRDFAKLTGVSVRTLHYYDEIGLLKPSFVDEQNGYRFYDENALQRMQEILFYRELDFPLKSISKILFSPNYDKQSALEKQKRLLTIKKERLERLINAIDNAEKGEKAMNFDAFDNSEYENERNKYIDEAKEKWGDTAAFKEFESKKLSENEQKNAENGLEELIEDFAKCKNDGVNPDDSMAQELVKRWQVFITKNYYTCTKEILFSLGQMYVGDERFKKNIDKHGENTAEFITNAITKYCEE